jgi:hypothetical protein
MWNRLSSRQTSAVTVEKPSSFFLFPAPSHRQTARLIRSQCDSKANICRALQSCAGHSTCLRKVLTFQPEPTCVLETAREVHIPVLRHYFFTKIWCLQSIMFGSDFSLGFIYASEISCIHFRSYVRTMQEILRFSASRSNHM